MAITAAELKVLGGPLAPGAYEVWAYLMKNQNGSGLTIDHIARKLKLNYMTVYLRLGGSMSNGYVQRDNGRPAKYYAVVPS